MNTPQPLPPGDKPRLDALSNETINAICAEAIGVADRWTVLKRGLYYRPNGNGYTSCIGEAWILTESEADKHVYPHDEPVTKEKAPLPDFVTDPNAALTLCDWMAEREWQTEINQGTGKDWECEFVRLAQDGDDPDELTMRRNFRVRIVYGAASTLPLAITRAFLIANGLAQ